MDRVDPPIERRFFETKDQSEAEFYVAQARGFKSVAEFRAFRAAKETREVADYERRLAVLNMEVK